VHVLGRVYAVQKDRVHDFESGSRRRIGQGSRPRYAPKKAELELVRLVT
jgi:hypothetical protein